MINPEILPLLFGQPQDDGQPPQAAQPTPNEVLRAVLGTLGFLPQDAAPTPDAQAASGEATAGEAQNPFVQALADERNEYNNALDALLGQLGGIQFPNAPHMRQTGIDTPEERQILSVIQAATGDTGLVGATAKAIIDEETRQAAIEFQNQVMDFEAAKARAEMQRQNTMLGIEAAGARARANMDTIVKQAQITGDEAERQRLRDLADANIRAVEADMKHKLFQQYKPFLLAAVDPNTPEAESETLIEALVKAGVVPNAEAVRAVRHNQALAQEVTGAVEAYLRWQKDVNEFELSRLRAGVLPGDYRQKTADRLRNNINLSPEALRLLERFHPDAHTFFTQGAVDAPLTQAPKEPTKDELVTSVLGTIGDTPTLTPGLLMSLPGLPAEVVGGTIDAMKKQMQLGGVSLVDPEASAILSLKKGETGIQSESDSRNAQRMSAVLKDAGTPGIAVGYWIWRRTGLNPATLVVDTDGRLYDLSLQAAMGIYSDWFEGKVPTMRLTDGRVVQVAPIIPHVVGRIQKGATVTLTGSPGNWRLIEKFQPDTPEGKAQAAKSAEQAKEQKAVQEGVNRVLEKQKGK